MLFNSIIFLVIFLPLTLACFVMLSKWRKHAGVTFLGIASLAFYSWTEWHYLPLLLGSIITNYFIGMRIAYYFEKITSNLKPNQTKPNQTKLWLVFGLISNLGLLGYYKYSGLLVRSTETFIGTSIEFAAPILPVGISFFTFTQIAFLVDASRGGVTDRSFSRYLLFVSYFPHLIAGPILHHAAMIPQFAANTFGRISLQNLLAGCIIFLIGLLKKVILADEAAQFVSPVFDNALDPRMGMMDAWLGVLAYTCQIYFDFSGYTDMAIGISRIIGIALPENFNSPYKAVSITEFWRRWHISLSSFLRDYLYFSLGGNRLGHMRRYFNLMVTMVLGGIWHGASWTFLVWGGLHGSYLVVNHAWHWVLKQAGLTKLASNQIYKLLSWATTFLCVINAWVFFRAPDFQTGFALLELMYRFDITAEPGRVVSFSSRAGWSIIATCMAIALFLPNTLALSTYWQTWVSGKQKLARQTDLPWVALGGILVFILIATLMAESAASRSAFIYFNF